MPFSIAKTVPQMTAVAPRTNNRPAAAPFPPWRCAPRCRRRGSSPAPPRRSSWARRRTWGRHGHGHGSHGHGQKSGENMILTGFHGVLTGFQWDFITYIIKWNGDFNWISLKSRGFHLGICHKQKLCWKLWKSSRFENSRPSKEMGHGFHSYVSLLEGK